MHRKRLTLVLTAVSAAVLTAWLFGAASGPASGQTQKQSAAKVTVINVTVGKPSELAFTLSKFSMVTVGPVTFKVTNKGALTHDFKVCTKAVTASTASTCLGKGTKMLKTGQSQSLTLTFKKGKYEYLCTVPGHAAAGMKGLVGIGVKVTVASKPPTTVITPTKTVTTTPAAVAPRETLIGDPAAGGGVFTGADPPCGSCHTLRAAGANGTVGPDLDGSKPGQDLVVQRVSNGINVMPPYRGQLSQAQINNVAAYVYNATHPA
jgi:cytochrome c6